MKNTTLEQKLDDLNEQMEHLLSKITDMTQHIITVEKVIEDMRKDEIKLLKSIKKDTDYI